MIRKRNIQSKKISRPTPKGINQLIEVNQQYCKLLHNLVQLTVNNTQLSQSSQPNLINIFQNIKSLNKTMKKELYISQQFCNSTLDNFITANQLGNSSNLIGRHQQIMDEIERSQQELARSSILKAQSSKMEQISLQQKYLQQQLKKLTIKRIELQNKNEMIAFQLECGQTQLNQIQSNNLIDQIKLRDIQKGRKKAI